MSACLAGVLSGLLGELACVGCCGRVAAPCRAPAVADFFRAGVRLGASVGVDVWVLGRAGRAAVPAFALVPAWQPLALVTVVLGLGYYLLHGTLQTRATELAPAARGTAVALFAFSLFLGQGIGAAMLGVVVDGPGYTPAFGLAALALMALGGGFVLAERRLAQRTG